MTPTTECDDTSLDPVHRRMMVTMYLSSFVVMYIKIALFKRPQSLRRRSHENKQEKKKGHSHY